MSGAQRQWMLWAARLYPRGWRERYGQEFVAMIEEMPEGRVRWAAVADVVFGALRIRMRSTFAGAAVAGALLGAGVAVVGGMAIPDEYISDAVVAIDRGTTGETVGEVVRRALDRERLQRVVEQFHLYEGAGDAVEQARRHMSVRYLPQRADGSGAIHIHFSDRVPERARRVAQELTEAVMAERGGFSLLDAAQVPNSPAFPNRLTIGLIGMGIGLAAGMGMRCLQPKAERF